MLKRILRVVSIGFFLACAYACGSRGKGLSREVSEALSRTRRKGKLKPKSDAKQTASAAEEEKVAHTSRPLQQALLALTAHNSWKNSFGWAGLGDMYQSKIYSCWKANCALNAPSIQTALKDFGRFVTMLKRVEHAAEATTQQGLSKQVKKCTAFRPAVKQLLALVHMIESNPSLRDKTIANLGSNRVSSMRFDKLKAFLTKVQRVFDIVSKEVAEAKKVLRKDLQLAD